jgi:hypothetical protein
VHTAGTTTTEINVPQPAPLDLDNKWEPAQAEMRADSVSSSPYLARWQPSPFASVEQSYAWRRSLSGQKKVREALLLSFCDPIPRECSRLWLLSDAQWTQALEWLDISGLALYFLDRVIEQKLQDMIPRRVLGRLQQNLEDNTRRTTQMIGEANAIHAGFQNAGLSYATLKGFSLWPVSVPRLELRSQLDLDFLVAENDAPEARRILETRGYRLHAISGRSWEFKAGEMPRPSLKNLYKATPHRSAELHIEPALAERPLLARTERRCLQGVWFPVLAAEELFLGQGLHLFKHLCSEFSRAAHMLEFRSHVTARRHDAGFWARLHTLAEADSRAQLALGVATLWITHLMGEFAPQAFTSRTVTRVPDSVRLWIEVYGRQTLLAGFPGTKLYLLLQQEIARAGAGGGRPARQALVPRRLPPPIALPVANESLGSRMRRHWRQLLYILRRLRFHVVEDLRYLYEARQWKRLLRSAGL